MMEWLFESSQHARERQQREGEVTHADVAQQRATAAEGGVGLDRDHLELYDRVAHNLAAKLDGVLLAQAERILAAQWRPLRAGHDGEAGSLAAFDSLEHDVIQPAMEAVYVRTRQALERAGLAEIDRIGGNADMIAGFREDFLFETSFRLCGQSDHSMARAVLDGYLMPRLPDTERDSANAA